MKTNNELLRSEFEKVESSDKSINWLVSDISNSIVTNDGHIIVRNKEALKKEFCFGYSAFGQGLTYEEAKESRDYASTNAQYFINENLGKINADIESAKNDTLYIYKYKSSKCNVVKIIEGETITRWGDNKPFEFLPEEEKKEICERYGILRI